MEPAISIDALPISGEAPRWSSLIARLRQPERRPAAAIRTPHSHSPVDDARQRIAASKPDGRVYLVGAGPGDPDLLTVRAARLLSSVDVVVYDQLVGDRVLELVPAQTRKIYVGKRAGNHALPQDQINALLVALGSEGLRVARLKGGDPFIFGRGGEELEALIEAGIEFEVVPGVTAASGMAAYAGIPLTHRAHAQACVFVTGHLKDGTANLDWEALARPNQTLVIYMGVGGLGMICRELIAHGMAPDMPAALVEKATLPGQRTVAGTLATLPQRALDENVQAPALIVVGSVVELHRDFDWFERRPEARRAVSA